MIEQFTVDDFESALPKDAIPQGLQSGEFGYEIPLPHGRIIIRSSIGPNGVSAGTGQDSIRLWLEIRMSDGKYKPLKKLDAYTTRVTGWRTRMNDKIQILWGNGLLFTDDCPVCPKCGNGWPAISQSEKNPNRAFVSCRQHDYFKWIDEIANRGVESLNAPPVSVEPKTSLDSLFDTTIDEPVAKPVQTITPSQQQQEIISHDYTKPMRVLATAGSGKTWTTEQYIARLVNEGAKPGSILYVTFNKSMADEGAMRIKRTLTGGGVSIEDAEQYTKWFCTIHAASYRMLRNDGMKMQVAKNWEIKRELQKIIPKLWKDDEPSPKNLYTAICNAKMNYIHQLDDEEYFSDLFGEYHGGKVSQARRMFDFSMIEQRKITFPDMLYLAECNLNGDPSFRRKWQSQFEYVIVDEGQDTNAQAMRILTMLAKPQDQFVIVGDHDQMMYRFAGATPEANLLDGFSDRYSDSNLYMMDTNYRSRASIVKMADKLIQHNYANRGGSIAEVFRKIINPFSKYDGHHVHFEMYDDVYEEAKAIAEDIKIKLDSEEVIPGEIFIGARTRAQLGNLEPILTEMKIPFVNITGGSFWQFRHMKIAIAYLRLVADPSDSDAFSTIYNVASSSMTVPWRSSENYGRQSATRFLGKEFVKWYGGNYRKLSLINNDYEIPSRWRDGATDLIEFMDGLEYEIECEGVAAGVQYIINYCLTDWLRLEDDFTQDGDNRKIDDLYTLHDLAIKHKDLPPLLAWVQKCLEAADSARSGNLDEYVVLSTYHRLKGLERDYVYGMGWCEGQNAKTGKPMGLLPHTYALTTPPTNDPLDIPNQNSVADERSIGFVAITRAKKAVYLSGVRHYRNAVMWRSRFVEEMGLT